MTQEQMIHLKWHKQPISIIYSQHEVHFKLTITNMLHTTDAKQNKSTSGTIQR